MGYTFTKYSPGGGVSEAEVVQIVKTNFEGGVGYETTETGVIIEEQTLTLSSLGKYTWADLVALGEGVQYTVSFNGVTSVKTAVKTEINGMEMIYIGNGTAFGLEATDDLFFLYSVPSAATTELMTSNYDTVPTPVFSLSGTNTVVTKIDNKFVNIVGVQGTGAAAEVFNSMPAENASGDCSHAEGSHAKAIGEMSHAEGQFTAANGRISHTEGCGTIASGDSQHVQGKYNIEDTANKYAHIVGNGANSADRSNAHTIDWDGNAWFAGKVKVGGTGYDDPNAVELGSGGGGSSSPAIIEVAELPTENIDTSAFYKLITGSLYMAGIPYPMLPVVVAFELPDTGSANTLYVNMQDGKTYQYDEASSSYTDASQTFPAVYTASEIPQAGGCVLIQSEIWYYYGEWKKVQPPRVLKSITSTNGEVFGQGMLGVIQRGGEIYRTRFDNLTIDGTDFSGTDFETKRGVKKPNADGTVVETIVFTYYDLNFGVSLYFTAGLVWLGGFMVKDGGSVTELTDSPFSAGFTGTFTYFE